MEMVVRPMRTCEHAIHGTSAPLQISKYVDKAKPTARQTHFIQGFLNHRLALVVEGRCRHVQQQDARVPDQGPGDGNALLLTTAHLTATLPNQGVEFLGNITLEERLEQRSVRMYCYFLLYSIINQIHLWEVHDEVVGIGLRGGLDDVLHGDARSTVSYVLSDGGGKQHGLLFHNAH